MQFEPVEHAVLNIDPDEIGLCGCEELSDKGTRDAVGNTEERFGWVCIGVLECLTKVARVCEHGSTVGCLRMQMELLAEGLVFCHCEDVFIKVL